MEGPTPTRKAKVPTPRKKKTKTDRPSVSENDPEEEQHQSTTFPMKTEIKNELEDGVELMQGIQPTVKSELVDDTATVIKSEPTDAESSVFQAANWSISKQDLGDGDLAAEQVCQESPGSLVVKAEPLVKSEPLDEA